MNLNNFRLPFREDRPFSILTLAVLAVPLVFIYYTYEKFEIIKIALLLMLAGWAILALFFRARQGVAVNFNRPILFFAAGLSGWIILSSLFSSNLLNGFFGTYLRFTSSAVFYILVIVCFVLQFLLLNSERFIFLLKVLTFDAVLVSIVGIMQSFGVAFYNGLDSVGLQRAPSLLGNPNFSSLFIASLLPTTLYLGFNAGKFWKKVVIFICAIIMLAAVVIFSSRGAWLGVGLGFIFAVLVYLVVRAPRKYIIGCVLSLIVGAFLWYVSLPQTRPGVISKTVEFSDTNVQLRLFAWDIARQAMQERPILGTGPGNFQYFFQAHRGKNLSDQSGVFDDVHNLFFQIGGTLGILFLLAFIIALVLLCLRGIERAGRDKDFLPATLVISVVIFSVTASFTPVSSACFLLLTVLLAGLALPVGKEKNFQIRNPILSSAMVLIGILSVAMGLSFISSELIFFRCYVNYYSNNFSQSQKLCALAAKINPTNHLFYVYRTGSEMQLGVPLNIVKQDMEKFAALYPQDTRGLLSAASISFLVYHKTGNKDMLQNAIDYTIKAVKLDPYNADRYTRLAFYYYVQNSLSNASDYEEFGLGLNKNNLSGWVLLAKIKQLQGKVKSSRAALETAYKLRPETKILELVYFKAKNIRDKDFSTINIPLFFNPNYLE